MDQQTLNTWIMYHEIQKLKRLGFSKRKIAQYLVLNWRTVNKYIRMTEDEFEQFLGEKGNKERILDQYENKVLSWLNEFEDASAAQIFDWLKEHNDDLPRVSERTVYNFVMHIRQKHNIPIVKSCREYFPIEELPYGLQAQVDFGQYNMKLHGRGSKKVYFFAMVLSRSRMKFIYFRDSHFTSHHTCIAHEKSFEFFQGIPTEIVYDLDRLMVVDENLGKHILTNEFGSYVKSRNFKRHFCRKADPESKGKVENVIGYVKKNFLYNRKFIDIDTLNNQGIEWLARTGNNNIHNQTKKSPLSEFLIEKTFLSKYTPLTIKTVDMTAYTVRKNNVINYKGNFYSLPMGTYNGSESEVLVEIRNGRIEIYSMDKTLICSHELSLEKGKSIRNTNHRRDKSKSVEEMMIAISEHFSHKEKAIEYFKKIQEELPRYTRDHMQVIKKALSGVPKEIADKTLDFCIKHENYGGHEFESALFVLWDTSRRETEYPQIKPMNKGNLAKANEKPDKSDIDDYQNIINN